MICILYATWNFIVFIMYGIDKLKAKKRMWRIKEKTLLISAFLMGGAGAFLGMIVFHHKTKHAKFRYFVPVCLFINLAVIVFTPWFRAF